MFKKTVLCTAIALTLVACSSGRKDPPPAPNTPRVIEFPCSNGGSSTTVSAAVSGLDLNLQPNWSVDDNSSHTLQNSDLNIDRQAPRHPSLFGSESSALAHADFDNDGDTDMFLAANFNNGIPMDVELYLNDGLGNFTLHNEKFDGAVPAGIVPRKAIVGYYNTDNILDIFVIDHGVDSPPFAGAEPILILSSGNKFVQSPVPVPAEYFHTGASADIDNDGDTDIFLPSSAGAFFLINDGTGVFTKDFTRLKNLTNWIYTAELTDVDKDGFVDILNAVTNTGGFDFTNIMWGDSSGTYSRANMTTLPEVDQMTTVVDIDVDDLDGDGDRDIVITRTSDQNHPTGAYNGYYIQILDNVGSRQFVDKTGDLMKECRDPDASFIDWIRIQYDDSDRFKDIVVDGWRDVNTVWFNNQDGSFTKN